MERRLISGHSPYEAVVGFSRAVVAGDRVYVAGTAPIPADGSRPPDDAYEQARLCLRIIRDALERAGSDLRVLLQHPVTNELMRYALTVDAYTERRRAGTVWAGV